MKQHDSKDLVITCTDNGQPVDLTAASEVRVIAKLGGAALFSRTTSGSNLGVVNFKLTTTDSAAIGAMHLEVQATWPGGEVTTFPEDGYLTVYVTPDLG